MCEPMQSNVQCSAVVLRGSVEQERCRASVQGASSYVVSERGRVIERLVSDRDRALVRGFKLARHP